MGFTAVIGDITHRKNDRLTWPRPYSSFTDIFRFQSVVGTSVGFNHILARIVLLNADIAVPMLAVERAEPPSKFSFAGAELQIFENEGAGGRIFLGSDTTFSSGPNAGLKYLSTGFTLIGLATIITGNKLALNSPVAKTEFAIVGSTILKSNIFRIRRAYDTSVVAEVIGVGTGALQAFSLTTANAPICPSSVKISFTDPGGAKTDRIRDNGAGLLVTTDPDILLDFSAENTINYETGEIVLNFHADHIPTATNITISYEYNSTGEVDKSDYDVSWEYAEL